MEFNVFAKDLKPIMDDAKKILNPKSEYDLAKAIHCSIVGDEFTAYITDAVRVHKHIVKLDTSYGLALFTLPYTKITSKDKEVHVIVENEKTTYYIDDKEEIVDVKAIAYEDIEGKVKTEYPQSLKINPKFLIDALSGIKGDNVVIDISENMLRVDGRNVVMLRR